MVKSKIEQPNSINVKVLIILGVLVLILGFFTGSQLMPKEVEADIPEGFCDLPIQEAVDAVICEPETYIEFVEAPSKLDLAVSVFMKSVEEEEDEAGNKVNILKNMKYDFDEVSIKEISEEYNVSYTEDTTIVEFSIELKFKDSHDTEKETYNVKVTFEDQEDTIVEAVKL